MAYVNGNKPIITNGLVYALDFGNTKSYTSGANTARSMVFDPSGTTAVTSSAVVQYPTYTLTTPFFNNGVLDFQGAEFIRRTGSLSVLDPEKEFTIHIVSKVANTGNLFSINTTSGNLSTFVSQSNTTFGFNISAGDFSRTYPGLTTSSLQHVTYRYSSGSIDLFINGIPITASAVNQSLLTAVNTNALFINKDPNTSTFQTAFSGSVGQFYVYNRALTADEIYSNYLISAEKYNFPTVNKPYTLDENVYKYVQTAGITDQNTISAISTFVAGLKLNKLWDKIVGIYPFIGNTTGSQRINLKDPGVLNLTYSGSWSASNSGSTPATNTSYIQSPLGSGTTYPTINSQSFHASILSYDTPQTSSYIAGGISGQGALGGTVTYANGKVIHTFTTEGSSSIVFTNPSITQVEVLVVGGGGGGGRNTIVQNRGGGGGGAGGLIFSSSFTITPLTTLDVVVGAGGIGGKATFPNCTGSNGENSQFGTLVAFGGGGGGPAQVTSGTGSNGGSGGGAGRPFPNSFASGGLGIPGQGNDGGIINDITDGGGSGGGGAGGKGLYQNRNFSEGGPGLPISISGMPVSYSAGGRSGHYFLDWTPTQINGLPNTGNGGWGNRGADAGKGGSGVVIVSYNLIPGGGPKTGIYLTETSVSGAINNETPAGITGSGTIGLLTISRTGSTSLIISKNNTTSSIASAASPKVSLNLPFGATNQADQISTITPYSVAYASIGAGLTTSEVSTYYNLVSQLQTNLKRQNTLLDNYSGAAAAYSLRRIGPSGYFGPAIRVRRDSDNTLRDIGFTSDGQLDTVGLLDFVGVTGSGFVQTWYDQSGNGKDATQATTANQPEIINSGSVITQNTKPSIQFDGLDDSLSATQIAFTNNLSFITVSARFIDNVFQFVCGQGFGFVNTSTTSQQATVGYANDNNLVSNYKYNLANGYGLSFMTTVNTQYLHRYYHEKNANANSYLNNSTNTIATVNNDIQSYTTPFAIGRSIARNLFTLNGSIQEIIAYTSSQNSNDTGIADNINSNYKIYGDATASFDPDYQAFITATGITQPTQSAALETLVSDLKSYGLWSKMKAIYPMVTDKNNRFAQSEDFSLTWNPVSSSVTVNQITAPNGTLTADLIREEAGTGDHYVYQTVDTLVSGNEYVLSVYGRFLNRPWIALQTNDGAQAWFNLQTGVTGSFTGSRVSITNVGSGWYRCALFYTASSAGAKNQHIHLADANGNYNYTGVATTGSYLWGAQFENGNLLGPYKATTSTGFTTGSMLDQMKFNLKNSADTDAAFRLVYSGNWNPGYSGAKPDGNTAYADTKLRGTSLTSNYNYVMGYYSRTITGSNGMAMGAGSGAFNNLTSFRITNSSGNFDGFSQMSSFSPFLEISNPISTGLYLWSRNSSTVAKIYKNNSILGSLNAQATGDVTLINNIYLGAFNAGGGPQQHSPFECAFATIGDGLTDYQAKALYWIVQKFQTTLGRQVY
jgi:hypothetical protein